MALAEAEISIHGGTPESRAVVGQIKRAIRLAERLNRIPFDEQEAIHQTWSELTGAPVDPSFSLIPPVYCEHGVNIRVGRNVFINQGCTLNDIGGIDIGDDVLIGPRVSLITPVIRSTPPNGAGRSCVVAAGAVVTRDVPSGTLVAGVPARVVKPITADDRPPSHRTD